MEEIMFKAMDIPNELKKKLLKTEGKITYGMTPEELKAYQLGADSAIIILRKLVNDENFIVHISQQPVSELTLSELYEIEVSRMLGYTE